MVRVKLMKFGMEVEEMMGFKMKQLKNDMQIQWGDTIFQSCDAVLQTPVAKHEKAVSFKIV